MEKSRRTRTRAAFVLDGCSAVALDASAAPERLFYCAGGLGAGRGRCRGPGGRGIGQGRPVTVSAAAAKAGSPVAASPRWQASTSLTWCGSRLRTAAAVSSPPGGLAGWGSSAGATPAYSAACSACTWARAAVAAVAGMWPMRIWTAIAPVARWCLASAVPRQDVRVCPGGTASHRLMLGGRSCPPVPGRRFHDAQLVAVWVSQDLPPKAELSHRLPGDQDAARRPDPLHLGLELASAQVKMHPVLGRFRILHALK